MPRPYAITKRALKVANMTAQAEAILIEVSREFGIDVRSLRSDARYGHFMPPRRAYAARCIEAGISCTVAGPVIGRNHMSFREWICQHRQAYKHDLYRSRRAPHA
jgi:hypothetical protein